MLYLSKSKYCSAVQCPKMLWLKKYMPDAFDDSVIKQSVFDRGNEVGDLAMGIFGDYVEVPYGDLEGMIQKTEELIDRGTSIITEASFSYNGLFCSVDILLNRGNRHVSLVEVKSSTKINDIYLHDVAYQVYVLTGLGFTVEKASLAYINNTYVRHGALNIQELFSVKDLTTTVKEMQPEVEDRVHFLTVYMEQESEPLCPIGGQCFNPYDCGFFAYCGKDLPKPNIFDVGGIQLRTKLANYEKGIISFEDIESKKALKPDKMLQVEQELHDLSPVIDQKAIGAFLGKLSYPLYFLDFESSNRRFRYTIIPRPTSRSYSSTHCIILRKTAGS